MTPRFYLLAMLKPALLPVALLFAAHVAFAKAPAGQGRACDAKNKCDGGLTCVSRGGLAKSTCELVCNAKTKCPEDQRCVPDGDSRVCRPINDGVGL